MRDRSSPRPCGSGCSPAAGRRRPSSRQSRTQRRSRCNRARIQPARPRCSATAEATGRSELASSGPPLGRPKWASRTTLPPLSAISRIVGSTRSMRVASLTLPFSIGTLRSTRSRTRLPETRRGRGCGSFESWVRGLQEREKYCRACRPSRYKRDRQLNERRHRAQVAFDPGDPCVQIRKFRCDVADRRLEALERRIDPIDLYFHLAEFRFER